MRASLAVATMLALAGCTGGQQGLSEAQLLSSFSDADSRIANATTQEHEFTHPIYVSITDDRMVIKAVYRSVKDGSFVLKRPDGNGVKFDTFAQPREVATESWYEVREPQPGRWLLSGHLTHGGAYAFGAYVD